MRRNNGFIRKGSNPYQGTSDVPSNQAPQSAPVPPTPEEYAQLYYQNMINKGGQLQKASPGSVYTGFPDQFAISQSIGGDLTPPIIGRPGVTNAVGGRDFLAIDVSEDFLPYINQASYLRKHFKVEKMIGLSKHIPKVMAGAKIYATNEAKVMSHTVIPTTTVALVARTMAVSLAVPREIADDAIINVMPMLRDNLVDRFILAEEEAFLLGDQATFNGTGSVRELFDGISVGGEYDSSASKTVMADNGASLIDAEGAPFTFEYVNLALENLDLLGTHPEYILGIISRRNARHLRGDTTLLRTLTNFGPSPMLRTGKLGQMYGVNLVQTNLLNPDYPIDTDDGFFWAFEGFGPETPGTPDVLGTTGYGQRRYSDYGSEALAAEASSNFTEAIFVHKDAAVIGDRQRLELEMSAHTLLAARSLLMTAHQRLAMALQLRRGICKVVNLQ